MVWTRHSVFGHCNNFYGQECLGHDRGYPCVFFSQPLPVPVNTVPLWVWVPVLLQVAMGGPVLLWVLNNILFILYIIYFVL